jgi:ribosome maturation factor RimP
MTAPSQAAAVRALAEPLVADAGLVLEDLTVTPAGRRRVLRVVVDLPDDALGGVPMDAVAGASRLLSEALDASPVMGGVPYVLEVTSPGVDRPLTLRRHWLRARGRLVRLESAGRPGELGEPVTGRLTDVDEQGVELDSGRRFGWEDVRRGRVEVEFGSGTADDTDRDAADDDHDAQHDQDGPDGSAASGTPEG